MSDHEEFLQAVIQQPDVDAPRLVYADWLEEHADPRGDFIRVQCELAKIPVDDSRWDMLEQREWHLLREHEAKWTSDIKSIVTDWQFHRGFVDTVSLGARAFVDGAEKLFNRAPIRNVKLTRLGTSGVPAKELAACQQLARLHGLALSGRLTADELAALIRSPRLRHLTALGLQISGHAASMLGKVVRNGGLSSVQELDLSGEMGQSSNLGFLAGPKCTLALTKLNLSYPVPIAGIEANLGSFPGLAGLTYLNLANNELRVAGGQALAASSHLGRLTSLVLEGCLIGVKGTQALAGSATLANLTSLDLRNNNIVDSGVQAITASPHWTKLRELYLGMNNLTAKSIAFLTNWPVLDQLTLLHFWVNHGIGDTAAMQFASSPRVGKLLHLDLGYTDLTAMGVLSLAKSANLSRLRHLNLEGNDIGDAGVSTLVNSPIVASLRSLTLARTKMKDAGAKAITESKQLKHLRHLKLNGNKLKAGARKALEERFGPGVCKFGQQ